MKSILVITAYAPTADKQRMLVQCINHIKSTTDKFDILVSSHAPLPEHIIQMVDYYIYDKDNRFSNAASCAYWKRFDRGIIYRFGRYSHEYPIVRLIRNALALAKENEYEFAYLTDFDNFYSAEDVHKLIQLRDRMFAENKSFIFFYTPDSEWTVDGQTLRGVYYDIFITGGKVDKYLDVFNAYFPKTLEGYNDKLGYVIPNRPQCMEHYFYEAFREHQLDTLVVNGLVRDYLSTSSINNSGFLSTICMILPAINGPHYLYLSNDNAKTYVFDVYIDDIFAGEYPLGINPVTQADHSTKLIPLHDTCSVRVDVYLDNEKLTTHHVNYNTALADDYKLNGYIEFAT